MVVDIFFIGCDAVKIQDIAGEGRHFTLDGGGRISLGIDPGEMIPHGHFGIAGKQPAEKTGPAQQHTGVDREQSLVIDHGFGVQQFDGETAVFDQFDPFLGRSLLDRFFRHAACHEQCTGKSADHDFSNLHVDILLASILVSLCCNVNITQNSEM